MEYFIQIIIYTQIIIRIQWKLLEKPFENNKVLQKCNLVSTDSTEYSIVVPGDVKEVICKKYSVIK